MGAVERRSAAMLKKASEMCLKAYQLGQRALDEYWDSAEEVDRQLDADAKKAINAAGYARTYLADVANDMVS